MNGEAGASRQRDNDGEAIVVEYDGFHLDAGNARGKAIKIVRSALPKPPRS